MNQPAKDALKELRSLVQWSWSGHASECPESLLRKHCERPGYLCFSRLPRCSEAADLLMEPKAAICAVRGEGRPGSSWVGG